MSRAPESRWAATNRLEVSDYGAHFADLVAAGADVEGEARLADVLVPRGARILDVGSGMGRVAAALQARGHHVTAVEPDPVLREQSAATYPDLVVRDLDALDLSPTTVDPVDLAVLVGNVMVYLAEGTEREVLTRVRTVLAPGGRVLAGFHLDAVKRGSRDYPPAEFAADAEAAGLVVEHHFGGYDLRPPARDYAVWVLRARNT